MTYFATNFGMVIRMLRLRIRIDLDDAPERSIDGPDVAASRVEPRRLRVHARR